MTVASAPAPPRARFLVLASNYLAQGLTWGFVSAVLVPWFAARGTPLEDQAAIFVLGAAPWIVKVLWGPVLDRLGGLHSGRARIFAAAGQVAMALCILALAAVDDLFASPGLVAMLWFFHNLWMSLQDAATDALAIDVLAPADRGRANAFMLGGHTAGAFAGSVAFGKLMAATSLPVALALLGGTVLLLAPVVFLLPGSRAQPGRTATSVAASARVVVSDRRSLVVLVVLATTFVADAALSAVSGEFFVAKVKLAPAFIYETLVPFDLTAQLLAYLVIGVVATAAGTRRLMLAGASALAICWVGFALLVEQLSAPGVLLLLVALQAVCTAAYRSGVHAVAMDQAAPTIRATHFAILMAGLNLGRVAGGAAAPGAVAALGFAGLFTAAAALLALSAAALFRVSRTDAVT